MPYTTWVDGHVLSAADMTAITRDPQVADVATSQSTTSGTYTDLATTGPSIASVTMAVGQVAMVVVSAYAHSNTNATVAKAGFAVSGAETQAASDPEAAIISNPDDVMITRACLYTAGVAGSHTFTMKFSSSGGANATFSQRKLIVKVF